MHITIINDCSDSNAANRQCTRIGSLIPNSSITYVPVANDLEAAGNLVDALDAFEGREGVVIVNTAPRSGDIKNWNIGPTHKWENGTPFAYFWYEKTLVLSSIDGLTLSLIKKLGLAASVRILDIPKALNEMIKAGSIKPSLRQHIIETQFRSYEFLPRIAVHLLTHREIGGTDTPISDFPDVPDVVWWVDNFGNCKTTLLRKEINIIDGHADTSLGHLAYFERLNDVPSTSAAIIDGSSGIDDRRFLEIVVQGRSAAETLGLASGSIVSTHAPSSLI